MKKKLLTSLLIIGLAGAAIVGGTLAWFTAEKTVGDNVFTAGTVKISANEEITSGAESMGRWNPGDSVVKEFTIKNEGTKTIALRGIIDGKWNFTPEGEDAAVVEDISSPAWTKNGDGNYYYDGTIAAGGTVKLVLKVSFDGGLADNQYQGKIYTLSAKFQAIQASHQKTGDEEGWEWDDFDNYNPVAP